LNQGTGTSQADGRRFTEQARKQWCRNGLSALRGKCLQSLTDDRIINSKDTLNHSEQQIKTGIIKKHAL
jgi:hypothetical protein